VKDFFNNTPAPQREQADKNKGRHSVRRAAIKQSLAQNGASEGATGGPHAKEEVFNQQIEFDNGQR
jgi:hypothetical protein